ncbi:ATP-binding cassette domain-containing protein [Algoriphagus sp.]|uniref:ATP-binding cassette domain-containing protein n=1 Tax=Algoriphagus sp. TaxID=1872435 RepID=UPI0026093ADB|nr:ATP-binding cassette domain-containing protein [Algoriphagus sp.]
MGTKLIDIDCCQVVFKGIHAFDSLSFAWKQGQHWAIIADSGWLQTAFLETIRGNSILVKGKISREFATTYLAEMAEKKHLASFRDLIAYVSQDYIFRNKSNQQNFYFQQRFNSTAAEESDTVLEYLEKTARKKQGYWTLDSVLDLLGLTQLADKSLIKLSNGECRRMAIAQGLLAQPKLFVMDHPMTGLDVQTRLEFGTLVKRITDAGVQVLICTDSDQIPEGISHVAKLSSTGIDQVWLREDFRMHSRKRVVKSWDWQQLDHLFSAQERSHEPLIELRNVTIRYGEKQILKQVDWQVRAGEKWVLQGPNGSGKSTLISLVIGEHPQAYSQEIYLFGRRRGTGESIWEVKRPIGFMAPELTRFFPSNQTCRKVILSGYFDTMGLFKKTTEHQESVAEGWMKFFGLSEDSERLFSRLSLEKQRWALLARALIKQPSLLILDEASQGMDAIQRQLVKDTLTQICNYYSPALIFVSHLAEDIPDGMDYTLRLHEGEAWVEN